MKSSKISSGSSTCTDARISSKQHCGQSASSLTRQFRYTVQRPLTSPWKTCVFSSYFSPSFRFLLMLVYPWAWLPYPKSSETFLPWRMIDVRVEWWHSGELTCLDLMLILIFLFLRESNNNKVWWTVFTVLMVATVAVRFYKLHIPERVWYYIKQVLLSKLYEIKIYF